MKPKNTPQKNNIRCIIFREKGIWYGVALEFNIVEAADTPREAMLLLLEAVSGYIESAQKLRNQAAVLGQETDPEYEQMWHVLNESKKKAAENVFFFGNLNVNQGAQVFA